MKSLYLAAFCAVLLSCSKRSDLSTIQNSGTTLEGTWKWARTDGGIGNHIHETPASTGKNIDLVLTNDHYSIYTNGSLTSQGVYTLESRNCIHDNTTKPVINFSSPEDADMMIETLNGLVMELSNDVYDGTKSIYSKN